MIKIPNDKFRSGMHRDQGMVLRAFDRHEKRFYMLKWHRRARKTTLAVNLLIREACKHKNSVYVYVAPTYTQAKAIIWRDPNMLFSYLPDQNEIPWVANESELWVRFPNNSSVVIKGADNPDSIRGIDAEGIVFDEWAMMKGEVWHEIFRPIIAQKSTRWAMFTYTPKGENHATQMWRTTQDRKEWHHSVLRASTSGLIPQTELELARHEMPVYLYDQEFECSEITDEDTVLITSRMLDNLRSITRVSLPHKRLFTCDPALDKGDECITYGMEDTKIFDCLKQKERDTMKIAANVIAFALRRNLKDGIIDAGGLGRGVYDRAVQLAGDRIHIRCYEGGAGVEGKRYRNQRTKAWCLAFQRVNDKLIAYPEDLQLRRQIVAVHYATDSYSDVLKLEPKDITRDRLGESPDKADSWVNGVMLDSMMPDPVEEWEPEEESETADSYVVESVL